MAYPCPVCEHAMKGDRTICGGCEAGLTRALDDVAWLADELDTTLSRQTPRTGNGSSEQANDRDALVLHANALPYDGRASAAAEYLRGVLVGWTRVLQERDTGPGPANTLAGMAGWLSARAGRLARHEAGEEAHEEITGAVDRARRAVDARPGCWYAGPCPGCGWDIVVRPGTDEAACRMCGTGVNVDAARGAMVDALHDRLDTAPQIAAILTHWYAPVEASLIRTWIARKRLVPHGVDARDRPLYAVAEAAELLYAKLRRDAEKTHTTTHGSERMPA